MAWFKRVRKPIAAPAEKSSRVPEGVWVKCPDCGQALYNKDLVANLHVCPKCAHHFRFGSLDRLRMLFDAGVGRARRRPALDRPAHLHRHQALHPAPEGGRPRRPACSTRSSAPPAASTASRPRSRRWSTASSAAAWASSSARRSPAPSSAPSPARQPVVIVSCSGGARMMEGTLSLMQMAKVSAALARLDRRRPALHLGAHRSDHRRRHRELRDARRLQHRRAQGAHRLRRPARHRADDPAEAARRASSAASSCSSTACSTSSSTAAS